MLTWIHISCPSRCSPNARISCHAWIFRCHTVELSVWCDCMGMISGPVRSPLRSDLYYFRLFLFYRFCLLVFNFKKLKRSDWISNSRASNFRIGFPSWRRTKRGGWCTVVHWEMPPLLPPYHHYNFLDFNQRKFLLSTLINIKNGSRICLRYSWTLPYNSLKINHVF